MAGSLRRDIVGLLVAHYARPHTEILTVPGFEEHEMPIAHTGGWPFTEEDEPDLWWTPLPSPTFSHTALGNKETDRHG